MRTSAPALLPLFRSEMQVDLLGLLLLQPERDWTLDRLSGILQAAHSSVHRELLRAVDAGIIRRNDRQRPHTYRAATDSPVYPALRDLIERTVGVTERLRSALSGSAGIRLVAVHGSWASGKVRPNSDIDVLVVSDGNRRELNQKIRRVGREIGRDIDASVLGSDDLRQLLEDANPFIRSIIGGPRVDVVGDLDHLLELDDRSEADPDSAGSNTRVRVP